MAAGHLVRLARLGWAQIVRNSSMRSSLPRATAIVAAGTQALRPLSLPPPTIGINAVPERRITTRSAFSVFKDDFGPDPAKYDFPYPEPPPNLPEFAYKAYGEVPFIALGPTPDWSPYIYFPPRQKKKKKVGGKFVRTGDEDGEGVSDELEAEGMESHEVEDAPETEAQMQESAAAAVPIAPLAELPPVPTRLEFLNPPPLKDLLMAHELFEHWKPLIQYHKAEHYRSAESLKVVDVVLAGASDLAKTQIVQRLAMRVYARKSRKHFKQTKHQDAWSLYHFSPTDNFGSDDPSLRILNAAAWPIPEKKTQKKLPYVKIRQLLKSSKKRMSCVGFVLPINVKDSDLPDSERDFISEIAKVNIPFIVLLDNAVPSGWKLTEEMGLKVLHAVRECRADNIFRGLFATGNLNGATGKWGMLGVRYAVAKLSGLIGEGERWGKPFPETSGYTRQFRQLTLEDAPVTKALLEGANHAKVLAMINSKPEKVDLQLETESGRVKTRAERRAEARGEKTVAYVLGRRNEKAIAREERLQAKRERRMATDVTHAIYDNEVSMEEEDEELDTKETTVNGMEETEMDDESEDLSIDETEDMLMMETEEDGFEDDMVFQEDENVQNQSAPTNTTGVKKTRKQKKREADLRLHAARDVVLQKEMKAFDYFLHAQKLEGVPTMEDWQVQFLERHGKNAVRNVWTPKDTPRRHGRETDLALAPWEIPENPVERERWRSSTRAASRSVEVWDYKNDTRSEEEEEPMAWAARQDEFSEKIEARYDPKARKGRTVAPSLRQMPGNNRTFGEKTAKPTWWDGLDDRQQGPTTSHMERRSSLNPTYLARETDSPQASSQHQNTWKSSSSGQTNQFTMGRYPLSRSPDTSGIIENDTGDIMHQMNLLQEKMAALKSRLDSSQGMAPSHSQHPTTQSMPEKRYDRNQGPKVGGRREPPLSGLFNPRDRVTRTDPFYPQKALLAERDDFERLKSLGLISESDRVAKSAREARNEKSRFNSEAADRDLAANRYDASDSQSSSRFDFSADAEDPLAKIAGGIGPNDFTDGLESGEHDPQNGSGNVLGSYGLWDLGPLPGSARTGQTRRSPESRVTGRNFAGVRGGNDTARMNVSAAMGLKSDIRKEEQDMKDENAGKTGQDIGDQDVWAALRDEPGHGTNIGNLHRENSDLKHARYSNRSRDLEYRPRENSNVLEESPRGQTRSALAANVLTEHKSPTERGESSWAWPKLRSTDSDHTSAMQGRNAKEIGGGGEQRGNAPVEEEGEATKLSSLDELFSMDPNDSLRAGRDGVSRGKG